MDLPFAPRVCAVALAALAGVACTRVEQAQQRAGRAPAHHPRTAVSTVMARQIEHAVDAGDGDMELSGLRRRVAADSKDLDARILLARLYTRRGYPDLALEHYRMAAAQFPDSPFVMVSLAKALRELDEPDEALRAIAAYEARHADGSWELLSLEGVLYDEGGDWKRAEAAHRAALALDGDRAPLHNNLGYNLLLQGKPEAAAAEFRRALDLEPRSQIAHNNLAEALAALEVGKKGQPSAQEALSEWQRTEGTAAAHNNLAAVLIEQGQYSDARAEIETALAEKPDFPEALSNLKLVSEKDGQPPTMRGRKPGFWKRSMKIFATEPAPSAAPAAGKSAQAHAVDASADLGSAADGTR